MMKKKKKINKSVRSEKRLYRFFVIVTIFLVVGIIYSRAMLSKINLEIQELSSIIKEENDDNQSLAMKINEMVSLDKIREVSNKLGLTYNNDNIKSVLE
jgi:cell division protein FtsL